MRSLLIILYLVCFGCYILYTRKPDFFDGEKIPAAIHFQYDSTVKETIPKAVFRTDKNDYAVDARYIFRKWNENEKVTVIYEKENPAYGAVYMMWGYWVKWEEIVGSIILLIVLFQAAVAITKNPTPEAVLEQIETPQEKKRKYID